MIPHDLLVFAGTVIIFLVGQLAANISVLSKFNTRLTRVETHILHLMREHNIELWKNELPPEDKS